MFELLWEQMEIDVHSDACFSNILILGRDSGKNRVKFYKSKIDIGGIYTLLI